MKKILTLSAITVLVIFTGCSQETKENAQKTVQSAKNDAVQATKQVEEKSKELVKSAKEKSKELIQKTKEAVSELTKKSSETEKETKTAVEKKEESKKEVIEKVSSDTNVSATETKPAVEEKSNKTVDAGKGKALFATCAGCHGANGKLHALGKAPVIAGQAKDELLKKLEGYKAGTRNKYGMGTIMHSQVSALSKEDLEALSDYISNLK